MVAFNLIHASIVHNRMVIGSNDLETACISDRKFITRFVRLSSSTCLYTRIDCLESFIVPKNGIKAFKFLIPACMAMVSVNGVFTYCNLRHGWNFRNNLKDKKRTQ